VVIDRERRPRAPRAAHRGFAWCHAMAAFPKVAWLEKAHDNDEAPRNLKAQLVMGSHIVMVRRCARLRRGGEPRREILRTLREGAGKIRSGWR